MKFENALVALKQGLKIQRISNRRRLNAICLFMKNGKLYTQQTHPLSEHKITEFTSLNASMILADDWTTQGIE